MTQADADELARVSAVDFATRLARQWEQRLGAELLGAYLIGSLAHGGFSRRYSDIDVALVTVSGLPAPTLEMMRSDAAAVSADWAGKLSVFWTDRHFSLGRFPPLDRVDYLDHARALTERESVRPARPTLEEIHEYLRGGPFANWSNAARRFAAADALEPDDHKTYLRTLLYPARFCWSWITGRVGSNDDAAAFVSKARVPGLDVGLIERVLACRRSADGPDALFQERGVLPSQIEACAALLSCRTAPDIRHRS